MVKMNRIVFVDQLVQEHGIGSFGQLVPGSGLGPGMSRTEFEAGISGSRIRASVAFIACHFFEIFSGRIACARGRCQNQRFYEDGAYNN
jgi:hypothetical protein